LKHSFIQITFRRTGRGCDGLASECLSYRLRTNRPGCRAVVAPFAKAAIGGASHAQPRVGLAPDVTRRVLLHCLNGRGANLSAAGCQPWRSRPLGGASGRTTRRSFGHAGPLGLREAVIVPDLDYGPVREPRRAARRAILPHMVFAAPGARRLRGTATASLCPGTEPGAERRRGPMQSGGLGVLVPRGLKGSRLTAGFRGRAPQPAIWHVRAGDSHRNRAVHRGADQRSGPVRPRADHRSIQGGCGPVGHARRRRNAGPARAGWVGGGWRGLSVPAGVVGLVAVDFTALQGTMR